MDLMRDTNTSGLIRSEDLARKQKFMLQNCYEFPGACLALEADAADFRVAPTNIRIALRGSTP